MRMTKFNGLVPIFYILTLIHFSFVYADGGYFSSESVAVSADQRAIIIQNGNEISMTFSTGYTGEGENFGWIIPVLVPPDIEDVSEAGENGEAAFEMLDKYTAPVVSSGRGCFPAGTEVLTESGSCAIETVEPGTKVYSCNIATGEWVLKRVLKRLTHHYEGDIIAIQLSPISVQATGNHPFYVMSGDRLFSRPLPRHCWTGYRATGMRWTAWPRGSSTHTFVRTGPSLRSSSTPVKDGTTRTSSFLRLQSSTTMTGLSFRCESPRSVPKKPPGLPST